MLARGEVGPLQRASLASDPASAGLPIMAWEVEAEAEAEAVPVAVA